MNRINKNSAGLLAAIILVGCSQQEADMNAESASKEIKKETVAIDFQAVVNKDIAAFRNFYEKKFPNVKVTDFKDGAYAIDEPTREQWLEIEEFPPYELNIDEGEEYFNVPFANGKTYADCFPNHEQGVRQNYPYFDQETKQVITLELAINQCRLTNNESELEYGIGELAAISAYLASNSREQIFDLKVDSQEAYDAFLDGKQFFYSKRGQLNFACADCHMNASGAKLRADILSPAIGHPTSMPVYRSNWGDLGTIHRRYRECNKNVRAEPLAFQSEAYRNLEFFQSLMSTGFTINGPSSRR